mmetsp:Transcript_40516/g.126415  ORF Transcript_40516/g.126415 Transcript_40516/m.126415 type:complete len:415 (+) Transcript_40516:408-1652(+)
MLHVAVPVGREHLLQQRPIGEQRGQAMRAHEAQRGAEFHQLPLRPAQVPLLDEVRQPLLRAVRCEWRAGRRAWRRALRGICAPVDELRQHVWRELLRGALHQLRVVGRAAGARTAGGQEQHADEADLHALAHFEEALAEKDPQSEAEWVPGAAVLIIVVRRGLLRWGGISLLLEVFILLLPGLAVGHRAAPGSLRLRPLGWLRRGEVALSSRYVSSELRIELRLELCLLLRRAHKAVAPDHVLRGMQGRGRRWQGGAVCGQEVSTTGAGCEGAALRRTFSSHLLPASPPHAFAGNPQSLEQAGPRHGRHCATEPAPPGFHEQRYAPGALAQAVDLVQQGLECGVRRQQPVFLQAPPLRLRQRDAALARDGLQQGEVRGIRGLEAGLTEGPVDVPRAAARLRSCAARLHEHVEQL